MVGVQVYSDCTVSVQCVQGPVAGHNPSVSERASERMGLGQSTPGCQSLVMESGPV